MDKDQQAVDKTLAIMAKLRDPEEGCPWDLEQNFQSIVPHTLEEVYEVVDAIEKRDYQHLKEELGDLFFQIVFYSQLAKEQGYFHFSDIAETLNEKLIRRHPHVFDPDTDMTPEQVAKQWEEIKQAEKQGKAKESLLDDVPKAMPALMRAQKIQKQAAKIDFDWPNQQGVLEKVFEELDELKCVISSSELDQEHLQEELGDVLFSVVNLIRHSGFKAEDTMRKANEKFESRFRYVEQQRSELSDPATADAAMLEEFWQQAKQMSKKNDAVD